MSSRSHHCLQFFSFLCLLLALTSGCAYDREPVVVRPPLPYAPGQQPEFFVLYYPYGPSLVHRTGAPVPRYSNWTNSRMARDLKRIAECGFTGVLLHLPPEYLEHTLDKRDRYAEFVRIADSLSLKIVFMVAPLHGLEGSGVAESGALAAWLINSSLQSSPALYRVRGKPLALCHSSIRMSGPRHPAIVFQRFSKDSLDWKWRPPLDPKRLQSPGAATCSVIYTGWKGTRSTVEGGWALPRGKWCENLRGELWRAFSAKSRRIVVSSWNDFQNGDAAEPNDIDGTKASDVLTEEIRRVKLACSPSTTSSGTTGDSAARQ